MVDTDISIKKHDMFTFDRRVTEMIRRDPVEGCIPHSPALLSMRGMAAVGDESTETKESGKERDENTAVPRVMRGVPISP